MTAVATITGVELDYWVARAEGIPAEQLEIRDVPRTDLKICVYTAPPISGWMSKPQRSLAYSTVWAQGGPLIDKYLIEIERPRKGEHVGQWSAWMDGDNACGYGETALIATMRALVASVYGDSVPDEVAA